jgi:Zn-dependent protease with chaperone function/uncharacterized protein YgiM (DUF1202 family)
MTNQVSISTLRHPKESVYFTLGAIVGAFAWLLLIWLVILFIWFAVPILLALWIAERFFRAELFGNSVRVTNEQFPEILEIANRHCYALNLTRIPDMFVVSGNGVISALAIKRLKDNYILLSSNLIDTLLAHNSRAELSAILGHEIAHHAAGHLAWWRKLLLMPAKLLPFFGAAYSRACELTADRVGMYLCGSKDAATRALITLACGSKVLSPKANIEAFKLQENYLPGFFAFLHDLYSVHPRMTKRVLALEDAAYLLPPSIVNQQPISHPILDPSGQKEMHATHPATSVSLKQSLLNSSVPTSASLPFPGTTTESPGASADLSKLVAPLFGWIKTNKLLAGSIVGTAVLFFAVYKLFLQADPIKDAKRVAEAYCECGKATTERLLAKEKEFRTQLNAGTFKIRTIAQSEHDHIIVSDEATFLKCNDMAYTLYNEARSRFEKNAEDLHKFESALAEQRSLCADERANELNDVRSQVQMRIRALPYYVQQEAEPPPPMEQDAAAPSTTIGFITGDGVRLRSEPSTEGIIITKFAKGTQVEVLEWLEGWVRIRYQGYEGYVSADFIRQ